MLGGASGTFWFSKKRRKKGSSISGWRRGLTVSVV
ncbi:hypothetical protein [Fluviicoccus sp.]